MLRRGFLTLVLLASVALPGLARGADAPQLTQEQLREASAILGDTWSPFCPGRTLTSCTSGQAAEWREDVRKWLAAGLTRDQILARLQERVPGFTLQTIPDTDGTRYGPWVLGGVFAVILAGLGLYHARKSAGPTHELATATPSGGPDAVPTEDRRALSRALEALED